MTRSRRKGFPALFFPFFKKDLTNAVGMRTINKPKGSRTFPFSPADSLPGSVTQDRAFSRFMRAEKFFSAFYFLEVATIAAKEMTVNEKIRAAEVRVIDPEGNQLGVMKTSRALEMAYEKRCHYRRTGSKTA